MVMHSGSRGRQNSVSSRTVRARVRPGLKKQNTTHIYYTIHTHTPHKYMHTTHTSITHVYIYAHMHHTLKRKELPFCLA